MAQEIIYLTAEGYKKIKDELEHMRSVERPAISAAIAEARDKGDLSENAEYDAAREAQGLLEMRIAKLEDTMANARVIDESKIDKGKVQILSKVTLLNHNNQKQMTYTIVAEHEANLREGKLAIGTPIAKALLGRKKGDCVDVDALHFQVIATPGHTPGGVSLVCGEALFTGDTLFKGSCGRVDLPGGSAKDEMQSLRRLCALPGDYEVYPGHMDPTTLERERNFNYYCREASK